jgi:transcription antitermination factor NusG
MNIDSPLFPGYVFCKTTDSICGTVVSTPGVVRIVGFGGKPCPIQDDEIRALKCLLRSGMDIHPNPYLIIGQKIRIKEGPLAGLTGVLIDIKNQRRLVVSIQAVTKSVSVDISSVAVIESQ